MIVRPDKSLFFVATALMCSASLYGAELSSPTVDPMTRVFVGEPTPLTLPPGFPVEVKAVAAAENCATHPVQLATSSLGAVGGATGTEDCNPAAPKSRSDPIILPNAFSAANAKTTIAAQPIKAGSAGQVH